MIVQRKIDRKLNKNKDIMKIINKDIRKIIFLLKYFVNNFTICIRKGFTIKFTENDFLQWNCITNFIDVYLTDW